MSLSCQSQILKWCTTPQYLRDLQNSTCLEHTCRIGNNSHLPHFTKNKKTAKIQGLKDKQEVYYREQNLAVIPPCLASIPTTSSLFPSVIKSGIRKWKHSLDLNAQRESVGLKNWIAWTLEWANSEKIPNWVELKIQSGFCTYVDRHCLTQLDSSGIFQINP